MKRWPLAVMLVAACSSSSAPAPDTATGEVAAWAAGPSLLTPRANHCSAVIGSWVLAIGGNSEPAGGSAFVATDTIEAALLGADGTLGPWQVAGHTPSPVSECNATADGTQLYVIDGLYDDTADAGQIWTAAFDPATGMVPALTSTGALPAGQVVIGSVAAVRDDQLLLMHTLLPDDGDTTETLRTPVTGAPTWSIDDWKIGFRAQAQYAFADAFVYTLGGYEAGSGSDANPVTTEVYAAAIGRDGTVAVPPVATTALPTPTTFGQAVAVDDWVFVIGGRDQVFGAAGTTTTIAAPIAADGSLGAWQPRAALPVGRTNQQVVLDGDYLVSTGGAISGPGDALVYVARVRYPAP